MHYNLLFNGCSFTEGAELEGINNDYEYRRTHRFSHLISEQTGLTYDNISRGGLSNDMILRTTVNWFEEGNTCDHAIIQWTSRNRVEYFAEKALRSYHNTPRYYSIFPGIPFFNQLGKSIMESLVNIQNDSNGQNIEDRCLYWMEHLLKDKCSFDYLKLKKESEVVDEYYELGTYYKHRTKFPITYITDDILKGLKFFYCKNNPNYSNRLTGNHPNRLGHRKIAEHIINNFDYFQ